MERVETDRGVRDMSDGGFAINRGHVHADRLQSGPAVLTQGAQELAEHVLGAALTDEQHPPGVVISDHGQKLTAFAVGDLINSDPEDPVQPVNVEMLGDQPAHQRINGLPGRGQQHGHTGL
ncbi:MAG TPA: hypothetical protein VGB74_18695 [Actinoplanes sp.]